MAKIRTLAWGALALSWLFANQLWLHHFVPAAFVLLSLLGVCTDTTFGVCRASMFVLPASATALLWLALALILSRIATVRAALARPSLPRAALFSGLAFVAGALACSAVERGGTWLPALFADAVVLACVARSLTRAADANVSTRAPD